MKGRGRESYIGETSSTQLEYLVSGEMERGKVIPSSRGRKKK